MDKFIDHITRDSAEYTMIVGLLIVAIVANMPRPDQVAELLGDSKSARWLALGYKWLFDSMQAFMAARNPHSSVSSTVQTPTSTSHLEATVGNPTGPK